MLCTVYSYTFYLKLAMVGVYGLDGQNVLSRVGMVIEAVLGHVNPLRHIKEVFIVRAIQISTSHVTSPCA